jgi:hypothetical protein
MERRAANCRESPDDQAAVVAFLSSRAAHDRADVQRLDTHAPIGFLAGNRALKLKRAVHDDYPRCAARADGEAHPSRRA